jgi:DNA-binding CsgD family transcriptional regulator
MNHGMKHRLAIEAGGIGAWERDLLTHAITISPMLAQMMGLPPEHLELAADQWLNMVLPEDRPLLIGAALEQSTASEKSFDLEFRVARPDGKIVSLISRGSFINDVQGNPVKAIGVCFLNKTCNTERESLVNPASCSASAAAIHSSQPLTKKQLEVLRNAIDGKSVKETASALKISEATVRQHQRDARNRLGARTVMHAASLALRAHLI